MAFEQDFWERTESHDYMIRLSHQFPSVKKFVLAVGDVGEDGAKIEYAQVSEPKY